MEPAHEIDDFITPAEVGELMAAWAHPWWIAGGWCLDLFRNDVSRPHEDVDVVVLRRHLGELHAAMTGWELHLADPPGTLRAWTEGEPVPAHAHDVLCRRGDTNHYPLQFMVMDSDDVRWFFRRDRRINGPLAGFGLERDGLPLLPPELQLLYKSSPGRRPKDEADFARTLPRLGPGQRRWLREAIALTQPGHPWLDALAGPPDDRGDAR